MSAEVITFLAVLMVGITIANLMCFALMLKLYTEYFKDVSLRSRAASVKESRSDG